MKKLKIALFVLSMGWMAFVAGFFYQNNPYYLDSFYYYKEFLFYALFAVLLSGLFLFFKKKKINLDLLKSSLIVFLTALFLTGFVLVKYSFSRVEGGDIVNRNEVLEYVQDGKINENDQILFTEGQLVLDTKYTLDQLPEKFHQYFIRANYFESILNMAKAFVISLLSSVLIFLILSGIGQTVFFFNKKTENLDRSLYSFFAGAGILSIGIFFLAAFGVYNKFSFLILIGTLILLSIKKIIETAKIIFKEKLDLNNKSLWFLFGIGILFLLFSLNLVDTVRVTTLGWDDSNVYLHGAKMLALKNEFTQGIGPTAWMLLTSASFLFFEVLTLNQILLFTVILVGSLTFISLLNRFLKKENSVFATAFLLLLPSTTFFWILDSKVELPLLFTGAAAILAYLQSEGQNNKRDFWLFAFLLAFAITIKITAITFVAIFLLLILYTKTKYKYLVSALYILFLAFFGIRGEFATLMAFNLSYTYFSYALFVAGLILFVASLIKEKPHQNLRTFYPLLIIVIFIFALLTPWIILNATSIQMISLSNLIFGQKELMTFPDEAITGCLREPLAFVSDYKRYTGSGTGLKSLFLFPWNTTMSIEMQTFISDISFIFLGILPLWFLHFKEIFSKDRKIKLVFIFFLLYLLLWALTSSGVFWYGIFLLIPALLLLFYTLQEKEKWQAYILGFFIAVAMLSSFFLRSQYFASPFMFAYGIGLSSADQIQNTVYPGFQEIAAIVNKDENAVLYRTGTHIRYFLTIPDKNVVDDDHLDTFSCMDINSKSDAKILKEYFVKAGVNYILINYGNTLYDPLYSSIYDDRIASLTKFISSNNFEMLYSKNGISLYKIAP